MNEQRLSDLSEAEFDKLIDGYIDRTASGNGELPADVFVDLLAERTAAANAAPVVLSIDVRGNQLVITLDREGGDVIVQGNEVVIGGRRLVLRLAQPTG